MSNQKVTEVQFRESVYLSGKFSKIWNSVIFKDVSLIFDKSKGLFYFACGEHTKVVPMSNVISFQIG